MVQYALENGCIVGDDKFYSFDIDTWADTKRNPNIISSYWIGYIQSFHVKGHYEIKIKKELQNLADGPAYTFEIKNTYLHWAAGDECDAHEPWNPNAEKGWGWYPETAVWAVGDTLLGANFRHFIHIFQEVPGTSTEMVAQP
jgi:hypothetical protein